MSPNALNKPQGSVLAELYEILFCGDILPVNDWVALLNIILWCHKVGYWGQHSCGYGNNLIDNYLSEHL